MALYLVFLSVMKSKVFSHVHQQFEFLSTVTVRKGLSRGSCWSLWLTGLSDTVSCVSSEHPRPLRWVPGLPAEAAQGPRLCPPRGSRSPAPSLSHGTALGNQPDGKVLSRAGPRPWRGLKPLIPPHPPCAKHQNLEQGRTQLEPQGQASVSRTHPGQCLGIRRGCGRGAGCPDFLLTDHHRSLPRHLEVMAMGRQGPQPHALAQRSYPSPGAATAIREHQGSTEGQTVGSGWWRLVQIPALPARLLGSHHSSVSGHRGGPGGVGHWCREAVWRTTLCVCLEGGLGT